MYENTVEKRALWCLVLLNVIGFYGLIHILHIIVHILETSKFYITFHINVTFTDPAIVVVIAFIFNSRS